MQVVGAHRALSVLSISELDGAAACKVQRTCTLPQRSSSLQQHFRQAPSSRACLSRKSLRYAMTRAACRVALRSKGRTRGKATRAPEFGVHAGVKQSADQQDLQETPSLLSR